MLYACQQQGEKIAKFMAELQNIMQFRGYDTTLEDMLCD